MAGNLIAQIVAVDKNYGIGKDGKLPWPHDKEDMRLFRTLTTGNPVIMGRKTYDSLPEHVQYKEYPKLGKTRALPKRQNVIISKTLSHEKYRLEKHRGTYVVKSVDDLFKPEIPYLVNGGKRPTFIIGGASIYKQTIKYTDRIYMVCFRENYECDTFYPKEALELFWERDIIKYESFDLKILEKKH